MKARDIFCPKEHRSLDIQSQVNTVSYYQSTGGNLRSIAQKDSKGRQENKFRITNNINHDMRCNVAIHIFVLVSH